MKSIKNLLMLWCCLIAAPFAVQAKVLTTAQAQKNLYDAIAALENDSENAAKAQAVINHYAAIQGAQIKAAADARIGKKLGSISKVRATAVAADKAAAKKSAPSISDADATAQAEVQVFIDNAEFILKFLSGQAAINAETDAQALKDYNALVQALIADLPAQKAKKQLSAALTNLEARLNAQSTAVAARIADLSKAMPLPPVPTGGVPTGPLPELPSAPVNEADVNAQVNEAIAGLTDAEKATARKVIEKFKGLAKIKEAKKQAAQLRAEKSELTFKKMQEFNDLFDQVDTIGGRSIWTFGFTPKVTQAEKDSALIKVQQLEKIANRELPPLLNNLNSNYKALGIRQALDEYVQFNSITNTDDRTAKQNEVIGIINTYIKNSGKLAQERKRIEDIVPSAPAPAAPTSTPPVAPPLPPVYVAPTSAEQTQTLIVIRNGIEGIEKRLKEIETNLAKYTEKDIQDPLDQLNKFITTLDAQKTTGTATTRASNDAKALREQAVNLLQQKRGLAGVLNPAPTSPYVVTRGGGTPTTPAAPTSTPPVAPPLPPVYVAPTSAEQTQTLIVIRNGIEGIKNRLKEIETNLAKYTEKDIQDPLNQLNKFITTLDAQKTTGTATTRASNDAKELREQAVNLLQQKGAAVAPAAYTFSNDPKQAASEADKLVVTDEDTFEPSIKEANVPKAQALLAHLRSLNPTDQHEKTLVATAIISLTDSLKLPR